MKIFKYVTPVLSSNFITCDWNEGDNHLDSQQGIHLDRYVRSDLESEALDYARNVLDIPDDLRLKLTTGSDAGILITLLYLSARNFSSFRMRENDYAQVRAFAETTFDLVDVVDDELIFTDIPPRSVVYISNPGNPNCNLYTDVELLDVITTYPESLFIIDLAYIEFESPFDLSMFNNHTNVVFFRTFSKFWGVAGARLGAIVYPATSQLQPLYQVLNSKYLTQQHISVLRDLDSGKSNLIRIRNEEKTKLFDIRDIIQSKFDVKFFIAGNFIRIDCPNLEVKKELADYFRNLGISVRDISHLVKFQNSLRFSYREKAYEKILL
jgi:histidinol-phosphate/aromatic aminotransferase/cobyric acid decarboxylase-like protein